MPEQRQASPVTMEMPIEFDVRGRMPITFVGDEGSFDEAVPADDAYEIELLETGERPPNGGDLFASLTERQQMVLETRANWAPTRIPAKRHRRRSPTPSARLRAPWANTSGRSNTGCSRSSSHPVRDVDLLPNRVRCPT